MAGGGAGGVPGEQVLIDVDDLVRDDGPVEALHGGGGGLAEARADVVVGEQRLESLGEGFPDSARR